MSNAANPQVRGAVGVVLAVAEAIRDLKEVPSGHLYAQLMGHMELATYNKIIDILKNAGMVREQNHLLTWTGPNKE